MSRIRVLFFGTPDFALCSLKELTAREDLFSIAGVVTQPDKPAGRGQELRESPVKSFAKSNGIPVFQPTSIKREIATFTEQITQLGEIDIGVVVAFGQILPESILKFPKNNCINVHASLLPRWRGAAPIQRSLMAGDQETGVCIMQMDKTLDTGAVYSEVRTEISQDDDCRTLHDRLAKIGAQELVRTIPMICNREIEAIPQSAEGITYAERILSPERLINWNLPAIEIERKIRGFSPSPGAYTLINKARLKILKARAKIRPTPNKNPGEIFILDDKTLEIVTASGTLSPLEVQLEGRTKMTIAEFIRGNQIHSDLKLG